MRPLQLKLKGLRSYREEQSVDFSDASLFAIVGDTGAGKSSLLEAITVALYGTCTWDNKEIKSLISDGAQQLSVELTFRADGKTWRVTRSTSRTNYPPSVHRLECMDDGSKLDGERAVKERIRQIVGLDYASFLRAVVLPQGRFAMLLQAADAERTSILKGILRLDRLERVRDEAKEALDRMQPVVGALQVRRAALLPDPAQAAKEALAKREAADETSKKLAGARAALVAAREQARVSAERAGTIETLGRRVREADDTGAATRLREIESCAVGLDAEGTKLADAIAAKRGEEDALKDQLDQAKQQGREPTTLERARGDIETLRTEGPAVDAEAAERDREDEVIRGDAQRVEQATAALRELEAAEAEARGTRDRKEEEAKAAAKVVELGERLIEELRKAEREERRSAEKLEKATEAMEKREEEATKAAALEQKAKIKREEAAIAFEAAQRREAAHLAARGAKPGDPCPVCERALPADFRAPRARSLETAKSKLDEANEAHSGASKQLAKAEERVERQRDAKKDAEGELHDRRAAVEAAGNELRSGLSGKGDTDERLAKAQERASSLAAEAVKAHRQADDARDALTQARTAIEGDKRRLKERRDAAKKAREALAQRKARLTGAQDRLPNDLRPRLPVMGDEAAVLLGRIEAWREQFKRTEQALESARLARQELAAQQAALAKRRRDKVEAPAREIEVKLGGAVERLASLAAALQFEEPPARPELAALGEVAAWAEVLAEHASGLLERCEAAVASARADAARAQEAVRRALAEAGVEDDAALNAALVQVQAARKVADDDLVRAEQERPIAVELDARIARAVALIEALTEVRGLLADGKLVQHIVSKKQLALLGVASELLSSMTRGRYGFSEDFDVVDRLTGQARGTRTLSGGETFLASLALALGLIELAGRSGGRLDALFLDEGFGSLDAGSLSDALGALAKLADRGRLVAVISHVKAVAEAIDKVLAVQLKPAGSRAEWVTGSEVDAMLAEEVERGLLA